MTIYPCKLSILPSVVVNKLQQTCQVVTSLLKSDLMQIDNCRLALSKQLVSSFQIKRLDNELASNLLTTCTMRANEQAMRTHPDIGLLTISRAVTRALIGGGGHIHTFAFCPTNFL